MVTFIILRMLDFGTGNNNKINWALEDKQEMIDIVEVVYRGARKGMSSDEASLIFLFLLENIRTEFYQFYSILVFVKTNS